MIIHIFIFINLLLSVCLLITISKALWSLKGMSGQKQTQYKLLNSMYNNFELDIDDQEVNPPAFQQRPKVQSATIQSRTQTKFQSKTITKGFFNEDSSLHIEDYDPEESTSTIAKVHTKNTEEKQNNQPQRKRRSRREVIKLQPLKQKEKVDVFSNVARPTEQYEEEVQQINASKSMKKQEEKIDNVEYTDTKRRNHRRKIDKKQAKEEETKKENSPQVQIGKVESRTDILFADQEAELVRQNQQQAEPASDLPLVIPQGRLGNQVFLSSDEETIEVPHQQQGTEPRQLGSQYFSYSPLNVFKKQLYEPVNSGQTLNLEIMRDKDGFNTFWPQFHLHFKCDTHHVMSAKKTSSKPTSTFIISTNRFNYEENSQYYIGKMKSNLLGDVMNIFGPGLSPSNAKDREIVPRELLATVVFITNMFQMGKPRQFIVYAKKPEYKYYNSFPQIRMYEQEIGLNKLYQYSENKSKIIAYSNRKPVWLESISGYMLNFKGRVDCPSIKNFILQDKPDGKDLVIFGKITDNKFNMDVTNPISPYVAFGIALSSFDSRIMCE